MLDLKWKSFDPVIITGFTFFGENETPDGGTGRFLQGQTLKR